LYLEHWGRQIKRPRARNTRHGQFGPEVRGRGEETNSSSSSGVEEGAVGMNPVDNCYFALKFVGSRHK